MFNETKESIFTLWDERQEAAEKQKKLQDFKDELARIVDLLNDSYDERNGTFTLQDETGHDITATLDYLRETVDDL